MIACVVGCGVIVKTCYIDNGHGFRKERVSGSMRYYEGIGFLRGNN